LTKNIKGDVQVNNDSAYEVDLSGYRLRAEEMFVFPDRTYLLPNQTITVAKEILGQTNNRLLAVYDTEGRTLVAIGPDGSQVKNDVATTKPKPQPLVSSISTTNTSPSTDNPSPAFTFSSDQSEEIIVTNEDSVVATSSSQLASVVDAIDNEQNQSWPYLAIILVIVAGAGLLLVKPKDN